MATRVKIDPPNQLPSTGLTPIKYKQWKVALKIYLQQTPDFRQFYPGGFYPNWSSSEDNPHRISDLHANDNIPPNTDRTEHLAQRRIHLETFLGIIARYSDEGDFDDIMEKSTSLDWIYTLHERRYGIQKKGRHFNRIDSIRFDKATMSDYHKFYTDIRSCIKSNLRKQGDTIKYKSNQILQEDEKLSPTMECLIVYMAMERIDPRLPTEVDRIFGHRMDDQTTIMDLQAEIFSYIPRAIATLDRTEADLNAYSIVEPFYNMQTNYNQAPEYQQSPDYNQPMHQYSQPTPQQPMPMYNQQFDQTYEQPSVNAMYNRSPQPRMPFRPRQSSKPQFTPRYNQQQKFNKICKLCQALDLPPIVYNSHHTGTCKKKAQLQQIEIQEYDQEQANLQSQSSYHCEQEPNSNQD